MAANNDVEHSNQGSGRAVVELRPGHRIREIRHELRRRHHLQSGYQLAHAGGHRPSGPAVLAVSSDEYQARLYARSRSGDRQRRFAAVREAIATSPYTWEDLAADGVRDWVEESVSDDVLLAAALESLGELTPEERPYLGKFVVERMYEILSDAQARYWFQASGRMGHPR